MALIFVFRFDTQAGRNAHEAKLKQTYTLPRTALACDQNTDQYRSHIDVEE